MSMRDNRFMEPEKGDGVMGWAVRLLVFWAIAGVVIYAVVANRGMWSSPGPATKPVAALTAPQPAAPPVTSANSLILRAAKNGYVFVDASIDGTPIKMAFDTGASLVSLSQSDARKVGVSGGLNYTM